MHWPHFDLHGILLDLREDIGQIKGHLESNTSRLDRIEERVNRQRQVRLTDVMPALVGIVVLLLAAAGKMDWNTAVGLLSSAR